MKGIESRPFLSRAIPTIILSAFILTSTIMSVMFIVAIPYYQETEQGIHGIELFFEGVNVQFEQNGSSYAPVTVEFVMRVYNPSSKYNLVLDRILHGEIDLNNQRLRYLYKSITFDRAIAPRENATIIVGHSNIQEVDAVILVNALKDQTWNWELGNPRDLFRAFYTMNYKSQMRNYLLTSENGTTTEVINVG